MAVLADAPLLSCGDGQTFPPAFADIRKMRGGACRAVKAHAIQYAGGHFAAGTVKNRLNGRVNSESLHRALSGINTKQGAARRSGRRGGFGAQTINPAAQWPGACSNARLATLQICGAGGAFS
ncbi:MAG: hypothetical protein ACRCTI_21395 [Beijerinckiaceae bacterium]